MGKRLNAGDRHLGQRLRTRRVELKTSQERLAESLGITFQQLQKYERGENRISAGRLQQIADLLDCDIGYFFAGLDGSVEHAVQTGDVLEAEVLEFAEVARRIANGAARAALLELCRAIAEVEGVERRRARRRTGAV